MTVYVSIGNSDNKLSQSRWHDFVVQVDSIVRSYGDVHGEWFSRPDSKYQNACWCADFIEVDASRAKWYLARIALEYDQDSIAWAVAETEFIRS